MIKLFYVFDNAVKNTNTVTNNDVKCLEIALVKAMSLMYHKCVLMMFLVSWDHIVFCQKFPCSSMSTEYCIVCQSKIPSITAVFFKLCTLFWLIEAN